MYSLPRSDFHDITVGNNDYFGFGIGVTGYNAATGYDLASGLGSPIANLVVRDLVAASGFSFVASSFASGGSPSSGFFRMKHSRDVGDEGVLGTDGSSLGAGVLGTDLPPPTAALPGSFTASPDVSTQLFGDVSANLSGDISPLASRGRHARHAVADTGGPLDSYFADLSAAGGAE
jgi:hypothetical protein